MDTYSVKREIYGLPQAGRIAHDALVEHLDTYGYHPSRKTPDYGKTTVDQ